MRNVYFSFPFVRGPPEGLYSRHGHRLALWYTTHTHITTDTPEEVKKGDRRKIRQQLSKKGARAQTIQQHVPKKKGKKERREKHQRAHEPSLVYTRCLFYINLPAFSRFLPAGLRHRIWQSRQGIFFFFSSSTAKGYYIEKKEALKAKYPDPQNRPTTMYYLPL